MRQLLQSRWTKHLRSDDDDVHRLIEAAAETVAPAWDRPPTPSGRRARSRVILFPAAPHRTAQAPVERSRWPVSALVAGVLLVAGIVLVLRPAPVNRLPASVQGTWVTDAAQFAGQQVTLGARSISFHNGRLVNTHAITGVREWLSPEGMRFRVNYVGGSTAPAAGTFEFIYRRDPYPQILLAEQTRVVWSRVAGSAPERLAVR